MRLAFIAISIASMLPGHAFAHWQYTRWGMSVEEVIAASKGLAKKPTKPDTVEDGSKSNLLDAPYKTKDFKFNVVFWFDRAEKKLDSIDLKTAASNCPALQGALTNIYGPADESKGSYINFYRWWDRKNGNDIVLVDFPGESCRIAYREIKAAGDEL